jgi:hypothetical protein
MVADVYDKFLMIRHANDAVANQALAPARPAW